jgi:hypothetical protein
MDIEVDRPRITHVAVRFQDKIYSLPEPNRHHDVLRLIYETLSPGTKMIGVNGDNQGFLDESGRYLTRGQALVSAQLNDQILPGDRGKIIGDRLYSENLW